MNKIKIVLIGILLLSMVCLSGCYQMQRGNTIFDECKEFRCYYSSYTGGTLQIEYSPLGCQNKIQELNLFYVECKSR